MHTSNRPAFLRVTVAMLFLAPAVAGATSGSAVLAGSTKVVVRNCGAAKRPLSWELLVRDDDTWSVQSSGEQFAGTYAAKGRSGRKFTLTPDTATTAVLVATVTDAVRALCRVGSVTITSSHLKTLTLTLDRTLTKAKLRVRYLVRGHAQGHAGTAIFKAIGGGPWTSD